MATAKRRVVVVVNDATELGNDLVPDYMTSVRTVDFTAGRTVLRSACRCRVQPHVPELVAKAIAPDYALARTRLPWTGLQHRQAVSA